MASLQKKLNYVHSRRTFKFDLIVQLSQSCVHVCVLKMSNEITQIFSKLDLVAIWD